MKNLGRLVPPDFRHVEQYGLRLIAPATVERVEDVLPLPPFRARYDQKQEGACVGFGWSWAMSILNATGRSFPFYDARWLYHAAQLIDDWTETPPAAGTSVRAGGDVLRDTGHVRITRGHTVGPMLAEGIVENRWAQSADEVRTCIALGLPVVMGTNWYAGFDKPERKKSEAWVGLGNLGKIRGGHSYCIYGASDRRQAVKFVNNWGASYPLAWMPYEILDRLIDEYGEAAVITDRR